MSLPARIRDVPTRPERRIRCPAHTSWVRQHSCVVARCEGRPIEAMHVRLGSHAGMGQKPDDSVTVSGCSAHHAESHRIGEASFQAKYGLNLLEIAAEFASKSPYRHKFRRT